MKAQRVLFAVVAAAIAVPVFASGAHAAVGLAAGTSAAQCVRGCAAQKRECIQTARTTSLACKLDCRETSAPRDLGTCMRGCSGSFRDSKDACRADQQTCIAGCRSSTPANATLPVDASCFASCGSDLADCAHAVIDAGRTCLTGCRTDPDRRGCLQGCGAAAATGGEACAANFEACGSSCPAP